MQKKLLFAAFGTIACLLTPGFMAQSQQQPQPKEQAGSQFDVAGSYIRTLSTSTTGNGTAQTPTNGNGGMAEARFIKSTFLGAEIAYSYDPANQSLAPAGSNCGYFCNNPKRTVPAYQNEASLAWIISKPMGSLRPFAVLGFGFMVNVSTGTGYSLNTAVRPTYIPGVGTDFALSPRFGLRLQVRDNFYKAPNVTNAYPATGKFTQTVMPAFGVYFRL